MFHRLFLHKIHRHDALPTAWRKGRLQGVALVATFACMKAGGIFVRCAEGLEDGVVDDVSVVKVSPAIHVDLSGVRVEFVG
jgi:hypothetical protein